MTLGRDDEADQALGRWETGRAAAGPTSTDRQPWLGYAAIWRSADEISRLHGWPTSTAFGASADDADVLEHAVLHLSRGRFLRRRGERRGALADLREAERRFAALGAEPFLAPVRAELAAGGLRLEPDVAPPSPLTCLTPQEEAVARLVADGRSNKEIADVLVMSPKTVAYHLGHVYAKLGVRSRSQLLGPATVRPVSARSTPRSPRSRSRR